MKKLITSLSAIGLIALVAVPAMSATEGTVSATVTAQIVSVAVTDGNVSYGVLGLGTTEDTTLATGVDETQNASNEGNVSVDLVIRSSDATSGGTPWNLAASPATDEFTHEFSIDSGSNWIAFDIDNNASKTLATVATSGDQDFDLRIGTPDVSTDQLEHTVTVTVLATATP